MYSLHGSLEPAQLGLESESDIFSHDVVDNKR